MSATESIPTVVEPVHHAREVQKELRTLERQDWALWWLAIVVIFALTAGIVSFALSVLSKPEEPFFQFHLSQSVRGLVGVVLLFSAYVIHQQWRLRGMHRRLEEQIRLAAEEHERAETFMKLALTDPLTELHNRRFAERQLEAEMARAKRHGRRLTVLCLDLNDFKQINDRHGHAAGDLVLRTFAEQLKRATRGSDLAARVGGDEFWVLLTECPPTEVEQVIKRLRPLSLDFDGLTLPINFSAGWTEYRPGEPMEELLKRADVALYLEKKAYKADPPN